MEELRMQELGDIRASEEGIRRESKVQHRGLAHQREKMADRLD
jgi:hypothetical protein